MYVHITESTEENEILMSMPNARACFAATFCEVMQDSVDEAACSVVKAKCEQGHEWGSHLNRISQLLFNTMSKNMVAKMNDTIRQNSKKGKRASEDKSKKPSDRKAVKLQSKSS